LSFYEVCNLYNTENKNVGLICAKVFVSVHCIIGNKSNDMSIFILNNKENLTSRTTPMIDTSVLLGLLLTSG